MQVQAYVVNSSIAAAGALTQEATGAQSITALVLAGSVALGVGGTVGIGLSGAGVYTENRIAVHVKAFVDGDGANGISAASITLKAADTSSITAVAGAVSVAASFAGAVGVSLSIGVPIARNEIRSEIDAGIRNADGPTLTSALTSAAVKPGDRVRDVSTGAIYEYKGTAGTLNLSSETYSNTLRWTPVTTGAVTIEAKETAAIHAISAAASLALAIAGTAGIAISGAGAYAANTILTRVDAFIDGSILASTGAVTVKAENKATIQALIVALAAAVGGGTAGVGVAIGAAVAQNFIGWDDSGYDHLWTDTVATLTTGKRVKITDGPLAGQIYEYVGSTALTNPNLKTQVYSNTAIWKRTYDFLSTATVASLTTGKRVKVAEGARNGEIYEYVGTAPLPNPDLRTQEYGDATIWKRVGVDSDSAQVRAFVRDSSVSALGALELTAKSEQKIDALVAAAAVALAVGVGAVGASGAGVFAQNRTATDVHAFIEGDGSHGIKAASLKITADSSSGITSFAGAAAIAAAIGGFGGAVSIGLALAFNEVSDDVAAYVKGVHTGVATGTGAIVISATSRGAKSFDLTGVTDAQLDNAAKTNEDDPNTVDNPGTMQVENDERADDLAADRLILIALDNAFRTAGHELQPGFRYLSAAGTTTLVKGDTVKVVSGFGTGVAGAVFRYTGTGGSLDLATQTYTTGPWERVLPTVSAVASGSSWVVVAGSDVYMITKVGSTLEVSRPTINAITAAASVAAGLGAVGVAVSGAGAYAQNVVLTKTNAFIEDSTIISAGIVDLDAASTSSISAIVVAASAAIGIGVGSAGVGASIGLSIARNFIGARPGVATAVPAEVQAYVKDSSISAGGALTADAIAGESISALVVALSAAVGGGLGAGIGFSGAGVFAENRIATDVKAFIDGDGVTGISVTSIALKATDASAISAIAGSASLAAGIGIVGVAISIAVTIASNQIENQVEAFVANANTSVAATGQGIAIEANETATITVIAAAASLAVGGGLAGVAVSGAGAYASNVIHTKTNAYVADSKLTSAAGVALSALSTATIRAIVGAFSAAVGAGAVGVGVSIGISLARNTIGWEPEAVAAPTLSSDDRLAGGLAFGTKVRIANGPGAGDVFEYIGPALTPTANDPLCPGSSSARCIDLRRQDYRNPELWKRLGLKDSAAEVQAYSERSSIGATGALSLTATASETIEAIVLAASASLAAGIVGVGLSGAGAASENRIFVLVTAYIDGDGEGADGGISAASISLSATDTSMIRAITGAASLAAAAGGLAGTISIAAAIAFNEISTAVEAFIADGDTLVKTTTGAISLSATGNATIRAWTAAASASATFGLGAIGISGAGAAAVNVILTKANAHVDSSKLQSAGNVTLTAIDTSIIEARILAASLAISAGGLAVGASIGVALAQNLIGWTLYGSSATPAETRAYITNSVLDVHGALTLSATGSQTIDAIVVAGSVAVAAGVVGVGLGGAGSSATNRIAARIEASIDGDGTYTGGTHAYSISLSANDTSTIAAITGAAALAVGVGLVGAAMSVGVAIARNEISNQVKAFIANADSGIVGTAHTTAETSAALRAGDRVLVGTGYANGGSAGATYQYTGTAQTLNLSTQNYATGPWTLVSTPGGISLSAVELATITATTAAAAFAASGGLAGISFAGAGASARNVILTKTDAYVASSDVRSATGVSLIATSTGTQITAQVVSAAASLALGGFAGAIAIGVAVAENFIGWDPHGTTTATYTTDSPTPSTLANGQTVRIASGAAKGDVYEYVGTTETPSPNLKTQNYNDTTRWRQVGTTGAGETKAYVSDSSLVATTLTQTATSGETIAAIVIAASVAVAGGGIAVAAAGAGVYVLNRIGQTTQAYISGSRGDGIKVRGSGGQAISLSAQDTATITATGGAASVAAAIGFSGGAAAIAVALARNDIQANVEAHISSATVGTTSGLTRLQATSASTVTASSKTAALSASLSAYTFSGAGAAEDVRVTSTTKAYVSGGALALGGALDSPPPTRRPRRRRSSRWRSRSASASRQPARSPKRPSARPRRPRSPARTSPRRPSARSRPSAPRSPPPPTATRTAAASPQRARSPTRPSPRTSPPS